MKLAVAIFGAATLAGSAFGADPGLLNLAMPDAQVIAGVNMTAARISPLGQFLIARLPAGVTSLDKSIGFDPLQDVSEVLAASTSAGAGAQSIVALRGTFTPDKVIAALANMQNAPKYAVKTYGGATLITFTTRPGVPDGGVAFIGTTEAVVGEATSVMAAIDRNAANNAVDAALAAKVSALSGTEDAWIVSTVSPTSMVPAAKSAQGGAAANNPMAQATQFLAAVSGFSGGVKFGDNVAVNLDVVANSPQNAEALANVAKFLVSMATMNSNQAGGKPGTAEALAWLKTLQVTTSGTAVDISLSVPEAQIESLIGAQKPAANTRKGN